MIASWTAHYLPTYLRAGATEAVTIRNADGVLDRAAYARIAPLTTWARAVTRVIKAGDVDAGAIVACLAD